MPVGEGKGWACSPQGELTTVRLAVGQPQAECPREVESVGPLPASPCATIWAISGHLARREGPRREVMSD